MQDTPAGRDMSRKYFFHGLGRIPSGIPRSLSNTYDTDWSEVVKEGNNRFQKQNRLLHGRAAAWDRVKAKQIEEKDVNRPHPELDEELKQTCQEQLEAELELYGKRAKIHAVRYGRERRRRDGEHATRGHSRNTGKRAPRKCPAPKRLQPPRVPRVQ